MQFLTIGALLLGFSGLAAADAILTTVTFDDTTESPVITVTGPHLNDSTSGSHEDQTYHGLLDANGFVPGGPDQVFALVETDGSISDLLTVSLKDLGGGNTMINFRFQSDDESGTPLIPPVGTIPEFEDVAHGKIVFDITGNDFGTERTIRAVLLSDVADVPEPSSALFLLMAMPVIYTAQKWRSRRCR
jgi:hypothetical protein